MRGKTAAFLCSFDRLNGFSKDSAHLLDFDGNWMIFEFEDCQQFLKFQTENDINFNSCTKISNFKKS